MQALQKALYEQRRENEKLEKINAALMYRMEEGGFNHHSYRAFEHSVQLSEKVSQKTEELQSVLQKLEQSPSAQLGQATISRLHATHLFPMPSLWSSDDGFASA